MQNASTQTIPSQCYCSLYSIQSLSANGSRSMGTQTESGPDLTVTLVDDNRRSSGGVVLRRGIDIQYDTVSEEESVSTISIVFDSDIDSGYDSDRDPLRHRRNILGRLLNIDDYYDYLLDG